MCGTALQDGADPLTRTLSWTVLLMIAVPVIILVSVIVWLLMQFRRSEGVDMRRILWAGSGAALSLVMLVGALSLVSGLARGGGLPVVPPDTVLPEDFGAVPDFALTERSGETVTRGDLAGSFWIADFIFTRCDGMCPLLSQKMAALDEILDSGVKLVSFSVDPSYDTPEVLDRYAARVTGAGDPGRWLFLTGPSAELYSLIGEGFHLAVAEEGEGLIAHSDRFVLVDPDGHIRGYYHGLDEETVDLIASDLERLSTSFSSRR